MAEWDHSRVKWRHLGKGFRESFGTTYLLYCGNSHSQHSALPSMFWKYSSLQGEYIFPIIYHFISILSLSVSFLQFLSASRQPQRSAPSAYSCCIPLEQLGTFLTGTQSVLVRGVLYDAYLRRFPSLWKFSFHSEAALQSSSPCCQSVENACLPSKGAFLLFSLCDWRQMLISRAESCMEQHLPSPRDNTDKNYGIRTLNYESCSL